MVLLLHAHRLFHGVESEVLNQKRVFAGSCFQREASFCVGGHAGHLLGSFQQDDRCVFDGFSLFVHHAALGRIDAGWECVCAAKSRVAAAASVTIRRISLFIIFCFALYLSVQRYVIIFILCKT